MNIVILGLSITSSWGNGHATIFRGLVKALARRGHDVLFLERDRPWYAAERDLPAPPFGRTALYGNLEELRRGFAADVERADLVVVGSYVPEGVEVGAWVTGVATGVSAFYDIDTPITLAKLSRGDFEYLSPALVPRYDLYLSFCGGPVLRVLEQELGAGRVRCFYCSADPEAYRHEVREPAWQLGYLGTYSEDRQPALEALLLEPARRLPAGRFVVAGSLYPATIGWPANVARLEHLAPGAHSGFYGAQRFTLNVTRAEMVRAGYSPGVRLFEAAACGVPIISDAWPGLEEVFEPGREILVARSSEEVVGYLAEVTEHERAAIGRRARARVLAAHTSTHRAIELEGHVADVRGSHVIMTPGT